MIFAKSWSLATTVSNGPWWQSANVSKTLYHHTDALARRSKLKNDSLPLILAREKQQYTVEQCHGQLEQASILEEWICLPPPVTPSETGVPRKSARHGTRLVVVEAHLHNILALLSLPRTQLLSDILV